MNSVLNPPSDGRYLAGDPDKAAIISSTGDTRTYGEVEANSNAVAAALLAAGLVPGDAIALLLDNRAEYLEIALAARRAGFYYTPTNTHLTLDEVAYIVNNCEAKALFVAPAYADLAARLTTEVVPNVSMRVAVGGPIDGCAPYADLVAHHAPDGWIRNTIPGVEMFYSSGTTGRPKGIRRPLEPLSESHYHVFLARSGSTSAFAQDEHSIYLSPAPLYHAAPLMASIGSLTVGGTVVLIPRFDAELVLSVIEAHRITHAQFVPTMFVRMLRLPEDVRAKYDLSSLRIALHAAAPCPVPVKRAMIEWWGPIVHEYYNSTEAIGGTRITPEEWLAHPGSVGQVGPEAHILDDDFNELARNEIGTLWFESASNVKYHNDDDKTASMTSPQGYRTVGDMGYIDDDGYLFLTDRATFMIISGGVNIYPQEIEAAMSEHPAIADIAVFGVPNEEFGEEVKAVVQPTPGYEPTPELAIEISLWCREHMATYKCPRTIDFVEEMPRDPSGKLYKKRLRDQYWPQGTHRRIG